MDSQEGDKRDELLTVSEAAEHLKVSYRQMLRFIKQGEIQVARYARRTIRIRPNDLDDFTSRKLGRGGVTAAKENAAGNAAS